MKKTLSEEVQQYIKALENHMQQFIENIKNKNFDKLKENEDGFRDVMNAFLNFYYIKFQNDESVNDLKETLVQTLTCLFIVRTTLEKNGISAETEQRLKDLEIL
jgi:hypothetical protein